MKRTVYFKALPYTKEEVTLALESGVDGLIVPDAMLACASSLARCTVIPESEITVIALQGKEDEKRAAKAVQAMQAAHSASQAGTSQKKSDTATGESGRIRLVALSRGWEIIPVENLLASAPSIAVEAGNYEEARLALGVLERGVETLVLTPQSLPDIKAIMALTEAGAEPLALIPAKITKIAPSGMGHRVCVDTTSLMHTGQGMLVGNSAAFTFLVNAETERNEYVASRPFRINAGSVHAYCVMPDDHTAYLEELRSGSEVLIVSHTGEVSTATVGRVKIERRPMLLIEAEIAAHGKEGAARGAVFLQNAETIRLVTPEGKAISVVELKEGDTVMCRPDVAGRHFGMRITEDIQEE